MEDIYICDYAKQLYNVRCKGGIHCIHYIVYYYIRPVGYMYSFTMNLQQLCNYIRNQETFQINPYSGSMHFIIITYSVGSMMKASKVNAFIQTFFFLRGIKGLNREGVPAFPEAEASILFIFCRMTCPARKHNIIRLAA